MLDLLRSPLIQRDPEAIRSDPDSEVEDSARLQHSLASVGFRTISQSDLGVFEGAQPLHQAPSGAARSAGGRNSMLHEKSPADAELFSWSIGDSNP